MSQNNLLMIYSSAISQKGWSEDMMVKTFRRRSLLYVPGSSEKMLEKSLTVESDAVIYDLEDAVSLDQKESARLKVCTQLKDIRSGKHVVNMEIIVRINPLDSIYALDDLIQICPHGPDAVIIPKATVKSIIAADVIITMLESRYDLPERGIKVIALVETAMGVETVSDIINASSRLTAVQFGAEDYTKDMEIARSSESDEIVYSRNRLAVACRAYGVDCIDTPYLDYKNTNGCIKDTQYAKSVGMTGRCVIHPSLIEPTNLIFSPSPSEINEAEMIIAAYNEASEKGLGAVAFYGKMIDLPIMHRAKRLLEKAEDLRLQ